MCGFPYIFSRRYFTQAKPSLDEIQMQCLIRSLTYPTVYSVSLTNLILGSSILVSTTSLDNPIK